MPKNELKKDDLEAVLGEGEEIIKGEETEAQEADFLAGFEDEDNGYKSPEPDPAPGSDGAVKSGDDTDKAPADGEAPGDPKEDDTDDDDGVEVKEDDEEEDDTPPWLKHLQEMENRMSTRMRNVEGHIGGLKSQMMQARTEATQGGDDSPTAAQIKDATGKKGSTAKLDSLRGEFPEWAEALDELAENFAPAASAGEQQTVDAYTREEVAFMVNEATARARELALVDAAHPGWEAVRDTPEFSKWRDSQPEETQSLADSPKAADAIKMFDLYNEATTRAPAKTGKTKRRLERSVAPRTTGAAPVQHAPTEEDDFLAGFNGG